VQANEKCMGFLGQLWGQLCEKCMGVFGQV
jgi:hypothetical protein